MALGQIHFGRSGPELCKADPSKANARGCPFESSGHYSTQEEAETAYEAQMGGALPTTASKAPEMVTLSSNIGTASVVDGDLSQPEARALLSSGLCGDLALAIHRKTGGTPYFLSHIVDSDEKLAEKFRNDPNSIVSLSTHVLIESPTEPGHFVDAYGQSSYEDLEDNWDGATPIKGTPEMLEQFADSASADKLSKFADAAIALDKDGVNYPIDQDLMDWDEDDWDDDEDSEEFDDESEPLPPHTVKLQLDLGEAEVSNGDLSDPKTRFYLANGLCGDLAMAVRDTRGEGDVYFAMDSSASEEELKEHAERGELGALVAHAFVASKHHPGKFVDSYGVKTKDEIEEFFGFDVVKVDPKLLERYGSGESGSRGAHDLSEFAKTLERLDESGKSYSYYDM